LKVYHLATLAKGRTSETKQKTFSPPRKKTKPLLFYLSQKFFFKIFLNFFLKSTAATRVCQMAYFQTKNSNLGKILECLAIEDFSIFCVHLVYIIYGYLVYIVSIWHLVYLVYFSPFWYIAP
jgi:hypothetical protein